MDDIILVNGVRYHAEKEMDELLKNPWPDDESTDG